MDDLIQQADGVHAQTEDLAKRLAELSSAAIILAKPIAADLTPVQAKAMASLLQSYVLMVRRATALAVDNQARMLAAQASAAIALDLIARIESLSLLRLVAYWLAARRIRKDQRHA
jgi:hypothetical protein